MMAALDDVLAEREYDVGEGPISSAVLRIGKPAEHPDGDWVCAVQITGLGDDRVYEAAGVDSLQALMMALQMARTQLEAHRRRHRITEDLGV